MKERPILFSAPMIRALLAGTKTQTRRVVRIPPRDGAFMLIDGWPHRSRDGESPYPTGMEVPLGCPFGVPSDRLWVRETWAKAGEVGDEIEYRADNPDPSAAHWRPSIFMPRWASRITLEVTGVRVERLQEITEADAQAEGAGPLWLQASEPGCWWTMNEAAGPDLHARTAAGAFRKGWDTINGKRAPWASNPWCWVVSFRRVQP